MNLTVILIKNTAPLDFIFPVLLRIKEDYPEYTCNILYCDLSKYRYLRKSKFYSDQCKKLDINEYDYLDFLPPLFLPFKSLFRWLFASSQRDQQKNFNIVRKYLAKLESLIISKLELNNLIANLHPDIILLGNTEKKQTLGLKEIFTSINKNQIHTILLPHAPHHRNTNIIIPFYKEADLLLPEYCEYWLPYKYDEPWINIPQQKEQFHYIGYPGLDSTWLKKITQDKKMKSTQKVLFIIRKFNPKSVQLNSTKDFIYSYDEVKEAFSNLNNALFSNFGTNFEVIIKPHPSNDFTMVKKLIQELNYSNWSITFEPIYQAIMDIGLVVSMYSTIHLVPAMAGIPVIILSSSIQEIAEQDPNIQELYQNMQFCLTDNTKLYESIKKVSLDMSKKYCSKDQNHIRLYFPDQAIERCISRLIFKNQ